MKTLNDLYSVPEACLLSDIIQLLTDTNVPFEPSHLYQDVRAAVNIVHRNGQLQAAILDDPAKFYHPNTELYHLLIKWRKSGKKLFLLTNNNFNFVDKSLKFLFKGIEGGDRWVEDCFDAVFTGANKPLFFQRKIPFRLLDTKNNRLLWSPISELKPGKVYAQGSIDELTRLTQWKGSRVIYFGDHLDADIVEPTRIHGWRTGMILNEVEKEVEVRHTEDFRTKVRGLYAIEKDLVRMYSEENWDLNEMDSPPSGELETEIDKTEQLRLDQIEAIQDLFNENFGSIFRAHNDITLFYAQVTRYCDVYTSHINHFLHSPPISLFYPRYRRYPHEPR
eukprot:TRINITY_DN4636_c0_g1_i2.p1 TRINITY_DN4636_c0_g1~~TRINITY_DN4636_c0_g1_i2.p1  ORF type:complete len:335 (-),score=54.47 TRINITY_DN4636_c0_g1_i2:92-1096(-)